MHIKEFVQYFKKNHIKNLEKNFVLLAKKIANENEKDIYITEQSMIQNFEKVFGYKNESLAKRLYKFLSKRQPNTRVYFESYVRRLFKLLYGTFLQKNMISFDLYDYDGNGSINALDIYDLTK